MAKALVEVRNPNDAGHLGDHSYVARMLNELYGLNAYGSAGVPQGAGSTVRPDVSLGGVHLVYLPAGGNVTIGPVQSGDSAAVAPQFTQGQRLVLYALQPAGGGGTLTWDASYGGFSIPAHAAANAMTWWEFVNVAVTGAAPDWRLLSTNATSASGLLAQRPGANAVPAGFLYFATDDGPGTTYRSNGAAWTAIAVAAVGAGAELAYAESSTAFNLVTGNIGSAPAYIDVPGMSVTVPAGQAFYLEHGWLASWNENNATTTGFYGVVCRLLNIGDSSAWAATQAGVPMLGTAPVNVQAGITVLGSQRMAALAAPQTFKLQGKVMIPTATLYASMGNFYVYGGSGYPPIFVRARAV